MSVKSTPGSKVGIVAAGSVDPKALAGWLAAFGKRFPDLQTVKGIENDMPTIHVARRAKEVTKLAVPSWDSIIVLISRKPALGVAATGASYELVTKKFGVAHIAVLSFRAGESLANEVQFRALSKWLYLRDLVVSELRKPGRPEGALKKHELPSDAQLPFWDASPPSSSSSSSSSSYQAQTSPLSPVSEKHKMDSSYVDLTDDVLEERFREPSKKNK